MSVILLGGGTATAATVDFSTSGTLEFQAESGETNDIVLFWDHDSVTITDSGSDSSGDAITLEKAVTAVPCHEVYEAPNELYCPTSTINKLNFALKDKGDSLNLSYYAPEIDEDGSVVEETVPVFLPTVVTAGSGDDSIETGDADDTLTGGSGNDLLDSGDGDDTLKLRDGEVDKQGANSSSCGAGDDSATFDDEDALMSNCESITHYPASSYPGSGDGMSIPGSGDLPGLPGGGGTGTGGGTSGGGTDGGTGGGGTGGTGGGTDGGTGGTGGTGGGGTDGGTGGSSGDGSGGGSDGSGSGGSGSGSDGSNGADGSSGADGAVTTNSTSTDSSTSSSNTSSTFSSLSGSAASGFATSSATLTLKAASTQRLKKKRSVVVQATCDTAGVLAKVKGVITVRKGSKKLLTINLTKTTKWTSAGTTKKLSLLMSKKKAAKLKKLLKRKGVKAKVKFSATGSGAQIASIKSVTSNLKRR